MDRTSIIGVSLAIGVLVWWYGWYAPKQFKAPPRQATPVPAAQAPATSPAAAPSAQTAPAPGAEAKPTPPEIVAAETTTDASSPVVKYSFTNRGGGISRAVLVKHIVKQDEKEKVQLNAVGSFPIGAISERPGETPTGVYTVTANREAGEVLCERTTAQQVQISKKFILPRERKGPGEYMLDLEVAFTNRGAQPYESPAWFVHAGAAAPIHSNDMPTYTAFDWYRGNGKYKEVTPMWFDPGTVPLVGIQTSGEKPLYTDSADNIVWAGVKNQYFATIITAPEDSRRAKTVWARRFGVNDPKKPTLGIEGALGMPGFRLEPGQTHTQKFTIYAGPKEYRRLKKVGQEQQELLNFGIFKWISVLLLNSMNGLHGLFRHLGGYAAAIFVLTIIVRGAMWPLQNKATQSMKKMQAIQPKMTELREKYKDDAPRMNQELMKLYKDYGINPFGGCLPMLVQIPIFFGFYNMLGVAVELRNSRFLWVKDLSQPDTVLMIPGLEFPINILPLCMMATMLWQMKLTPKAGDPTQQKIMMFMPLIFVVFCYNFASALALYWTVQNLFSIVQLYLTRDKVVAPPQKIVPAKRRK